MIQKASVDVREVKLREMTGAPPDKYHQGPLSVSNHVSHNTHVTSIDSLMKQRLDRTHSAVRLLWKMHTPEITI